MTKLALARCMRVGFAAAAIALIATPVLAQAPASAAPPKIDAADTAWMISATALVLMMSIPGLALFYAGMVRKKNVLATMAQTLAAVALGSIVWMVVGYSLAFTGEGAVIGTFDRVLLQGMGIDAINPAAKTIPESVFMFYQLTFAVIRALVAGVATVSDTQLVRTMRFFAERMKLVVEPTGCLAAAAVLEGAIDVRGQRVGVIVSGGNIDVARYGELLAAR